MLEGNDRNIIGPQVRQLRKAERLTQDDLAARCSLLGFEIGRSTISHIETRIRGISDLEFVILAKALRVEISRLIPHELPRWKRDVRPPNAVESCGDCES
jgi:transcriptional regulator with XRE-family HTH domain